MWFTDVSPTKEAFKLIAHLIGGNAFSVYTALTEHCPHASGIETTFAVSQLIR